jgi:hypothetical protein
MGISLFSILLFGTVVAFGSNNAAIDINGNMYLKGGAIIA